MNTLTTTHIITIIITLTTIIGIGIFSGKKVQNSSDFDTGGRQAGTFIVTGNIIGTLVGGSSTIGTAQLSFNYGLSAWWFTLGSSIGCLLLAFLFVKPLRESGACTIVQIITKEFDEKTGVITGVLSILGLIINIIAQILAANALLSTMFALSPAMCAVISVAIMFFYVFGGVNSTGFLGAIKTLLLYFTVIVSTFICLELSGGMHIFYSALPHDKFFNLFARGVGTDLGAGISVILGVVSTQTYIQAIISGKSNKAAKKGVLLSAVLIPFIGLGSILIGYFMRMNFPNMDASQVFPRFIAENMNPIIGGVILATLLIVVVGTGAGTALGLGTTVANDIYKRFINKQADDKKMLFVTRTVIIKVMVIAVVFTCGNLKSAILTWGFMSMGLRAVVLLIPLCVALFYPEVISKNIAILSGVLGTVVMTFGNIVNLHYDPLLVGMLIAIVTAVVGAIYKKAY